MALPARAGIRTLAAAIAFAVPGVVTPAHASPAAGTESAAPQPDPRALVREARAAAKQGDFATALARFSQAMAIKPSPKLHYNIAVCHHRLMIGAEERGDETAAAEHRKGAVDAYNDYLRANPESGDREAVEQLVLKLGGQPATAGDAGGLTIEEIDPNAKAEAPKSFQDEWDRIERWEREQAEQAEQVRQAEQAEPAPTEPTTPPPRPADDGEPAETGPVRPRVRIGAAATFSLIAPADLAGNDDVEGLPLYGGGVYAGAYLGRHRRLNLGGEIFVYGSSRFSTNKHGLGAGHLGITLDHGWTLGRRHRAELGVGGTIAVGGQTLRRRDAPRTEPTCPIASDDENEVSRRGFLVLAGRLSAAVLLGSRRRHALVMRVTPGLGLIGKGEKGGETTECMDGAGPTPFAQLGQDDGAKLVLHTDIGYAARF